MEKKKYDLCIEILRRLSRKGVLAKIIVVGSWCLPMYETCFRGKSILPPIRTRDMEFFIPIPLRFNRKIDLFSLLKDLGFVLDYKGDEGYIVFQHPDLILEFLAPARGKTSNKPYRVNQLGINAQPLRFMDALTANPIQIIYHGVEVMVPHPADFALHKLLIARRRKQEPKARKDRVQAIALLTALNVSNEWKCVIDSYRTMPRTWQRTIRHELTQLGEDRFLRLLEGIPNPLP